MGLRKKGLRANTADERVHILNERIGYPELAGAGGSAARTLIDGGRGSGSENQEET
jgi:hypothetical protein